MRASVTSFCREIFQPGRFKEDAGARGARAADAVGLHQHQESGLWRDKARRNVFTCRGLGRLLVFAVAAMTWPSSRLR